ncbi:hypothetical protein QJS04_geneDACA016870 [Acorus gramineus]|uniref:Reverse transcriptase n=1 Tax=Acorus gramineus TaxID=55184 RepID=A0AAV9BKX9_ACOGR|nr:hypothetical protein QJS04_geneDACA016870 [Acorus gramineus]
MWCNLRAHPSCTRLDRVLVNHLWEDAFPLCSLKARPRICSDHSPLIFDGGEPHTSYHHFKFENWWLLCEGFCEVVFEAWWLPTPFSKGAKKVAFKLKWVKQVLKRWSRDQRSNRHNSKSEIEGALRDLEVKEESSVLSEEDRIRRANLKTSWF